MRITIGRFNKYNPRKDLKSMPWLRLENDFYDKQDFYDADVNTRYLFIFLLCQCAQKVSDTIDMPEDYLIFKSKLTKKQFFDALSALSCKLLISLETNGSDLIRTDSYLTNEQNEQNEQNEHDRIVFDLDAIYQSYPRKQGKKSGIDKLSKIITSDDIYQKILHGAEKYANYHDIMKTDKKYIKQFSAWVNQECWDDEITLPITEKDIVHMLDSL